ncbi:MAG: hypothetical protein WA268_21650 [Xanthobacteraceae bacterium]
MERNPGSTSRLPRISLTLNPGYGAELGPLRPIEKGIVVMEDRGWGGDHVGKLSRLQTAVRTLVIGYGTVAQRLEKATYPLMTLLERDFPEHLRNRARPLLELRSKYVFHAGDKSYFHQVKPSDRLNFVTNLLALYEACLIDLGRAWPAWDFMYPTGDGTKASKRRVTPRT